MAEVIPTILTSDINTYRQLFESYNTFAKRVQIDICDGNFTPTLTIHESNIWWSQGWALSDIHMMVMNPSKHLPTIIKLKPNLCIFHAETNENLLPIFEQLKANGIKAGVALLPQTYPGKVKEYIQAVDHCLIFAGKLGGQGGKADLLQIEKVPLIKSINPNLEIGWDGGANIENIREIAHSDIDVINVGSAIANAPDQAKAYNELSAETERGGVRI